MSYSYQFRLKIIKLVTEQDYGIREVAKLHQISHALVIYWLKAFRERGLDGVKSPYTNLQTPKIVKPKMKKKILKFQKPQTFHLKRLKSCSESFHYKEIKRNYHEVKRLSYLCIKRTENEKIIAP